MFLTFNVNMAQTCKSNCAYCYLPKLPQRYFTKTKQLIDFVFGVYKQRWFWGSGKYEGLMLQFWGGEPTENTKAIQEIYQVLHRTPTISFNVFTNGVWGPEFRKFLLSKPRVSLQVSYDGEPLQYLRRGIYGLDAVEFAVQNDIPVTLKSTIMLEDLAHMYDCYCDVKRVIKMYKLKTKYSPSLDTFSKAVLNKELLSEQLRKIQTEDAQEVNRYFHWNTKTCCPGSNLFGIDLNGDIYGCHGMFYFKDVFKPLSTITSESVFKDLQIAQKELKYYTKERIHETISCPIKTITEGYTQ